jgi:DNA-damage-inducible protein D
MAAETNIVIERIKKLQKTSGNGRPYWTAREIQGVLDYAEWREFREVIEKAQMSCEMAGNFTADHFVPMPEMVEIGSGAERERENFALSQYACYLIAMNGNPAKPEIAVAQAYFVEKTYLQERTEALSDAERRAILRDRVKVANRKLGDTAKDAGVRSSMFGVFHDAGYKGLYDGLGSKAIKARKGIGEKDNLLDCIGPSELAANEFRVTQADDKLRRESIKGEQKAIDTHHAVGLEVRNAIKKLGGTMPEDLPAEPSIKNLKSPAKQIPEISNEG